MRFGIILFLIFFTAHCSALRARWYGRADWKYRSSSKSKDVKVPVARFATGHAEFEIWSASGRYNVCIGPMLFPFWPSEPPILNDSNVILNIRIKPRSDTFRIRKESFILETSNGKREPPSAFIRFKESDAKGNNLKHYSAPIPGEIPVNREAVLELPYYGVRHSRLEWYSIRLKYVMDGAEHRVPRIRLRPRRDYDYTPIESPFYMGPGKF